MTTLRSQIPYSARVALSRTVVSVAVTTCVQRYESIFISEAVCKNVLTCKAENENKRLTSGTS